MTINTSQDEKVWTKEWDKLSTESEIQIWDFFGLRQWITKFTPRYGKTIEAGCGLGRYVFYLSKMGIDIEGVDFSESVIERLNQWKSDNGYNNQFIKGNILNLDYPDNSLSGYISLGVVEHFIDGPHEALAEAYRVLRPGGVAIISTPNISFYIFILKIRDKFKHIIKKIIRHKGQKDLFHQYWYRPGKLSRFMREAGFDVRAGRGADIQFVFCEMGNYTDKYLKKGTFGYWFSNKFENTPFASFGAQSITISIKRAPLMHCFVCGELKAGESSLKDYSVPVCEKCRDNKTSAYYLKEKKTKYGKEYRINPELNTNKKNVCEFCNKEYLTDRIFEDYGFSKNVCNDCLRIPEVNIELCSEHIKPLWRERPPI
jgi:ubiquinone/menaquinone biosynthesis C-methylase UbiE